MKIFTKAWKIKSVEWNKHTLFYTNYKKYIDYQEIVPSFLLHRNIDFVILDILEIKTDLQLDRI